MSDELIETELGPASPAEAKRYHDALHAMQSGVAFEMESGGESARNMSPKHLRVGINSAFIDTAALIRILVKKGVFTYQEFQTELADEAEREVARYEARAPKGVTFG